ncbi:hypothetical protein [Haladaptatus salinisoli]|uniref:hypothetical protein n=1 Tax=Haladaptatus salinisoli TaxID=2884876 RepID=UPI001D0BA70C|nr:hypothetical protein [Haladaptatus salinisoli]
MGHSNAKPSPATSTVSLRRTLLQTFGGVIGLLGIGSVVGQTSTHILTITAPYGHETFYQFVPTDSVQKLGRDPYRNVPASAVTVDGEDDIKSCLVHGATNGGADVYRFTGQLSYVNFSGLGFQEGSVEVYLDGRSVDPIEFQRGTPPNSDTNTDCAGQTQQRRSKLILEPTEQTQTAIVDIQVQGQLHHTTTTHQSVRVVVNGGENATVIPFTGQLVCIDVKQGDVDAHIKARTRDRR